MDTDEIEVKIRWLTVTGDDIKAQALELARGGRADETELKYRVLAKLGITDRQDTPLKTYLKAMHEENGLPFSLPAHPAITNAVMEGGAFKFFWWLA